MPLGTDVSLNIKELYADNKKKGKARGAGGKLRSRKQIIAIAMAAAGKSRKNRNRRIKKMRKSVKSVKSVKSTKR